MRSERGISSSWLVAAIAAVVAIAIAFPLVMASRTENRRTEQALDLLEQANEAMVQANLDAALRAAQIYVAEHDGFEGYGPAEAARLDPSVPYTTSPMLVPGQVTIRVVGGGVVLATATSDGESLCVATTGLGSLSYGRADAATPAECAGGW